MPDVPDRPKKERDLAKALAIALGLQFTEVIDLLGNPPDLSNVPSEWWDDSGKDIANAMMPTLQSIYLTQAEELLKQTTIGVSDFGLVNTQAIEWVNKYTFDLVRNLNDTTRRGLQAALQAFYENGNMSIDDLANSLVNLFGPVRAEMIAITEVTRASVNGELSLVNILEMENPNIKFTAIWQTAKDDRVCEICAPRDGTRYNEGWYDYPPAHPRCRCWVNHELSVQ